MTDASRPGMPLTALATAAYGAVLGSVFPVMAVMTTPDVSGGLMVAGDSGALVNTVQNVGSVAGILAAPSFAAGIGRGRTMALAGAGFAVAAAGCAAATNLPGMLIARFLHGVFGGVMPLMFMLIVMTSLRPRQGQFEGMTLFATSTSLFFGLAAGLGGWLSDTLGWRSLFWIQTLATLPYVAAAVRALPAERGNPEVLRRADWGSHALLSTGIGCIVFALSEGERHFWLEAWWVPGLCGAGILLVWLAVRDMARARRPLVIMAVFRRPTFSLAIVMSLLFRFGSLFAIFIVPQYLGRVQGLRPADFGPLLACMVPATAVGLVTAYLVALRGDTRLLLSLGLGCFALASWMCTGLSSDWALDQLRAAAAVAGLGMGLFSVAVLRYATFGAGMEDGPSVGLIFNMTRVLGIVVGLAILSHLLVEREKFHSAVIAEALGTTDGETMQRLATGAGAFGRLAADPGAAQAAGAAALGRAAAGQAFTMAFADTFTVTAIVLGVGALLVWALPAIPAERPRAASPRRSLA